MFEFWTSPQSPQNTKSQSIPSSCPSLTGSSLVSVYVSLAEFKIIHSMNYCDIGPWDRNESGWISALESALIEYHIFPSGAEIFSVYLVNGREDSGSQLGDGNGAQQKLQPSPPILQLWQELLLREVSLQGSRQMNTWVPLHKDSFTIFVQYLFTEVRRNWLSFWPLVQVLS